MYIYIYTFDHVKVCRCVTSTMFFSLLHDVCQPFTETSNAFFRKEKDI